MFEKKTKVKATIYAIEDSSMMNPQQYLTRNGYVCAGSDTRSHVDFLLEDDTHVILSLSNKEAQNLQKGMKGLLEYHRNIFDNFEACTDSL